MEGEPAGGTNLSRADFYHAGLRRADLRGFCVHLIIIILYTF